jgi:hypothetical protein
MSENLQNVVIPPFPFSCLAQKRMNNQIEMREANLTYYDFTTMSIKKTPLREKEVMFACY